ncbi:MAG: alpha/beta fold hydrolase [Lachnospiraceae bacterium]|nr:alpha/beta fold hydrolase [Lachnospiraceae bacterium]
MEQHLELVSEQDGLKLSGYLIVPEQPKAVLQIAHGMCEHKERYYPFMRYMAEQGYAYEIHDHRGHGKSVRSPEDLGYFYDNGGEALVEDLHQVTRELKKRFPKLPYFLFGHSMGSMAVRCYTKKYDDELDGLMVCGCPAKNPMAKLGLQLERLLKLFMGGHARSKLADKLFSDGFEKSFAQEGIPHAWICSDKEVVLAYNDNPLCNFTFTLNGYESLLWLVLHTYTTEGWAMKNAKLPIHFVSGSDDPCMISKEKFNDAVQLMKQVGYTRVTSHLYEGMRHEILNETGKEQVYADILAFYDKLLETRRIE